MGDPEAFQVTFIFKDHGGAEILGQEVAVFGPQYINRKGISPFFQSMDPVFKLGEHGLPEQGGQDIIDPFIHQVCLEFPAVGGFHEVAEEEFFVKGAGYLGFEDGIAVVHKGVVLGGVPGVHGVAPFMGQRKNIPDHIFLVIHQYIRIP
jgi:hypothetical protein